MVKNVEMAFIFKTGRQLLLSSESVVFPSVACKYTLGLITSVCWCFSICQLEHPEPKETLENMLAVMSESIMDLPKCAKLQLEKQKMDKIYVQPSASSQNK